MFESRFKQVEQKTQALTTEVAALKTTATSTEAKMDKMATQQTDTMAMLTAMMTKLGVVIPPASDPMAVDQGRAVNAAER